MTSWTVTQTNRRIVRRWRAPALRLVKLSSGPAIFNSWTTIQRWTDEDPEAFRKFSGVDFAYQSDDFHC